MEELLVGLFTQPTAHHICDSGGIYGRAYQRNAERDLKGEPQATLKVSKWGPEITVSAYHHLMACLELDHFCEAFNALPCPDWDSDFYGCSNDQQIWLEDRMFERPDDVWNTCNWENNFDQTLQGEKLERDGEEYVLLQVHGGCDVRSGYTDAKLFKLQTWMEDYFMRDDTRFWMPREVAEKAGYVSPPLDQKHGFDADGISLSIYGSHTEAYDHRSSSDEPLPDTFWEELPDMELEGVQDAIEH